MIIKTAYCWRTGLNAGVIEKQGLMPDSNFYLEGFNRAVKVLALGMTPESAWELYKSSKSPQQGWISNLYQVTLTETDNILIHNGMLVFNAIPADRVHYIAGKAQIPLSLINV